MKDEKILEILWNLKTEDKFYFMTYGMEMLNQRDKLVKEMLDRFITKIEKQSELLEKVKQKVLKLKKYEV